MASDTPEPSPNLRYGVVIVALQGGRFLVIRRSQFVRAPGMHCFPGGSIEAGETEEEAVRRELLEELALVGTPRRLLWRSVTPWNVALAWWLTDIAEGPPPQPNPLEVEWFDWLTADQIRALPQLLASNVEFLNAWEGCQIERG